ncbi:hypothetical protein BJV78DRAFT_1278648 [Lactifluus subvellereus]|nr:hypothetical protein BJV78DRAFT_1278648 [Lactifluus subvellereus]
MSSQLGNINKENARHEKVAEKEDEYDVYLFWPSRGNGDNLSEGASSPQYGPVSIRSESTELYYSGLDSGPPSPLTFAAAPDVGPPSPVEQPLDLGAVPQAEPQGKALGPQGSPAAKYSTLFKMGLFFSQIANRFDRALDGVKIKIRKPKSQAS